MGQEEKEQVILITQHVLCYIIPTFITTTSSSVFISRSFHHHHQLQNVQCYNIPIPIHIINTSVDLTMTPPPQTW